MADVFSVTKSVAATLAGIAVAEGRLDDLELPVGRALPGLAGTPAAAHTLRQLLTMTRGAETGGPVRDDQVMALPAGWLERIAAAPQREPPGTRFRYDNGGAHLLGAALAAILGMPLAAYAGARLFGPVLDPAFARAMATAQTGGGPPEDRPYGYLLWVGFDPGPPPSDRLRPPAPSPAAGLVRAHLLPALTAPA